MNRRLFAFLVNVVLLNLFLLAKTQPSMNHTQPMFVTLGIQSPIKARRSLFFILLFSLAVLLGSPLVVENKHVVAQSTATTERVSVATDGTQGNSSSDRPWISADGRYVAFLSGASNLVSGDTNGVTDVFIRDRQTGQTNRVSVATDGTQGNGASDKPAISADGRYIAFVSGAGNLVSGDTNNTGDIFVRDQQAGQTSRVSIATDGVQADNYSDDLAISDDGRYVVFESAASNLVSGDTNGVLDIFVRDRQTNQTSRVSVATDGTQANSPSSRPAISGDGRYVVFESGASSLVSGDTNGATDVFVRDRQTNQTSRVSIATDGTQGNNSSWSYSSAISGDGRYVAFSSAASNLVGSDTNGGWDVFVRDRQTGQTSRVSVASDGSQGNPAFQSSRSAISSDGRYVAFSSSVNNLVSGDTNNAQDIFVHDRQTGQTSRVSVAGDGTQGNNTSEWSTLSGDGRYVAFYSSASNLVSNDTNGYGDIFLYDRGATITYSISGQVSDVINNLEMIKQANVNHTTPGGVIEYSIVVQNSGTGTTIDVTMLDPIPTFTSYFAGSLSATAPTADDSNPAVMNWSGNIPAGGTVTIKFKVNVGPDFQCPGKVNNIARLFDNASQVIVAAETSVDVHCPNAESKLNIRETANVTQTVPRSKIEYISTVAPAPSVIVLNPNTAISGVTISDGAGHTATTDNNGNYTLSDLAAGIYTLTPSKGGYTFSPASRTITVPPDTPNMNFTGTPLPTNRPPVANDQAVTTPQNTPVNITLTASDPDGDPLTYILISNPANGQLSGTIPNFTYTPANGFSGSDSFTFKVNDGKVDSNVATVSITVTPTQPQIDLEVTALEPPIQTACTGASIDFYAFVRNNGSAGSGTFDVQWSRDGQPSNVSSESIAPGGSLGYPHVWANIPLGQHTLTFTADTTNKISESNEGNNQRTIIFTAVDCSPPVADFTASPVSGNAPLNVSFHNSSTGNVTSCAWNYGDDQTGNSCADHNHQYGAAGSYTVKLTVSGPTGSNIKTRDSYITVSPPQPSVTIPHIEVTQVIQDENNSVPLITGKLTLARVYVDCSTGCTSLSNMTGILRGYGPSGELLGSPLTPSKSITPEHNPRWQSQRADLNKTLNFTLPSEWSTKAEKLVAEVAGVQKTENVEFKESQAIKVAIAPIVYDYNNVNKKPNLVRIMQNHWWASQIYPTSDLQIVLLPNLKWDYCLYKDCGTSDSALRAKILMGELWLHLFLFGGNADYIFGWLPEGTYNGGSAHPNIPVAIGEDNFYFGQQIFAHEVAHLLGRSHTKLGGCRNPASPYDWPDSYPNETIQEWGLNGYGFGWLASYSSALKNPANTYDYMSYCWETTTTVWTSPYTYRKIFSRPKTQATAIAADKVSVSQHYFIASGLIYTDNTATLYPTWVLTSTFLPNSPVNGTEYCLEAQNNSGVPLVSQCFNPSFVDYDTGKSVNVDAFHITLPYPGNVARIVLKKGNQELAVRTVSAHAPAVTVLSPNDGETWPANSNQTITWVASDADGDSLGYSVLYSSDGNKWVPLGTNITESQLTVNTAELAGGVNARIRVLVTDGVNTSTDESNAPFTVGSKGPQVYILSPEGSGTIPLDAPLFLQGYAYDLEDGTLGENTLNWTSNRDGNLGTGSAVLTKLSQGQHIVTLTATDSSRNTATVNINIFVGYRLYLPISGR